VLARAAACPLGGCPLNASRRQFALDAHGDVRSPYVLVGEAPGGASLAAGRPWTGQAGLLLRRLFRAAAQRFDQPALDLEDVFYLTDLVKCHPARDNGANRAPRAAEWRACAEHLAGELAAQPPRLVLVAGYRNSGRIAEALELESVDVIQEGWPAPPAVVRIQHPSPVNPTSAQLDYRVAVTDLFARILADRRAAEGER